MGEGMLGEMLFVAQAAIGKDGPDFEAWAMLACFVAFAVWFIRHVARGGLRMPKVAPGTTAGPPSQKDSVRFIVGAALLVLVGWLWADPPLVYLVQGTYLRVGPSPHARFAPVVHLPTLFGRFAMVAIPAAALIWLVRSSTSENGKREEG